MQPEKQESTWLYEALAWLEFHRQRVIAAGVLGLALLVAGYIYFWMSDQAELQANHALLALKPKAAVEPNQPAASATDFLKVAEAHASSAAAARALLLAAGELYREGRYAEAQTQFERLLERDRRGLLAPTAALGVAACLDAQDKADAAISAYQSVTAGYANTPAAARAKLALAVLYEARQEPESALKLYDELRGARDLGRASFEASGKREALLKQHPELAKTNAVATLPSALSDLAANTAGGTNTAPALTNKIAGQP